MNEIIRAYINKFAKIKSRILDSLESQNITYERFLPRLGHKLKSYILNSIFLTIYKNILYLYVNLNKKYEEYNNLKMLYLNKIYTIKQKINILEKYINTKFTENITYVVAAPTYLKRLYDNKNEIKLDRTNDMIISHELIQDVSIDTTPYISTVYKKSSSDILDLKDIIFNKKYYDLYYEYSPTSEITLLTNINDNITHGVLLNLTISFKNNIQFSAIKIDEIFDGVILYAIDIFMNNTYKHIECNEYLTPNYIKFLGYEYPADKIILRFHIPFGRITNIIKEYSLKEVNSIFDDLKLLRLSHTENIKNYIDEKYSYLNTNKIIYKYAFALKNVELSQGTYEYNGSVYYNMIPIPYNTVGFYLYSDQSTPNGTNINYYITIDNNDYLIIPSEINNSLIRSYIIDPDSITSKNPDNSIRCINGTISTNIVSVQRYISINNISYNRTITADANTMFYNIKNENIRSITSISIDDIILSNVTNFHSLSISTTPSYMRFGNTIITNRKFPGKQITIKYKAYPQFINLHADLITKNTTISPSIYNTIVYFRRLNNQIQYSKLQSYIDYSREEK